MEANKIVNQKDQVMLIKASSNSTSVSTTGLIRTSTFVQGLFLQYLPKAIITILYLHHLYKGISTVLCLLLSLQISQQVSLHEDIIRHLYKGIFTTVHLLLSLIKSLRYEVLR